MPQFRSLLLSTVLILGLVLPGTLISSPTTRRANAAGIAVSIGDDLADVTRQTERKSSRAARERQQGDRQPNRERADSRTGDDPKGTRPGMAKSARPEPSKTRQDRRQNPRQDTQRERRNDRKQAERKQEDKQKNRKQDSTQDLSQPGSQDLSQPGSQDLSQPGSQDQQPPVELASGLLPTTETIALAEGSPPSTEDRYIVVLEESTGDAINVMTDIAADAAGVVPTHVYENVFAGFAAVIPDDQLAAVENDPRVEAVLADEVVFADAQLVPTGIDRIDADLNPTANIGSGERVDVDVAVIDTAGNDAHPDLNVWAWTNCTTSADSDDHGHGTHVGGIIGALDNDVGVVGVAPGARIWNVRVLRATSDGRATGLTSWIICGLDFVAKHATNQGQGDIEVANLSLGQPGSDNDCKTVLTDKFHQAICRTVAAGVTVVVSAGNDTLDAANKVPAAYDEVITVSALADSDGQRGGVGEATWRGADDSLASFSNFGADIDIAAPGVSILSTVPTGSCALCDPSGYRQGTGTSMAAPHVAGAAALYLANNPNATPSQVQAELLSNREALTLPNDPDGIDEGAVNVNANPEPPVPPPAPVPSNPPPSAPVPSNPPPSAPVPSDPLPTVSQPPTLGNDESATATNDKNENKKKGKGKKGKGKSGKGKKGKGKSGKGKKP